MQQANPDPAVFSYQQLGERWPIDLSPLSNPESLIGDTVIIDNIRTIEFASKTALSQLVAQRYGIILDPLAMSDCQIERIHKYKCQLFNILYVTALYLGVKETEKTIAPRVHLLAGKAAPDYRVVRLITQLTNTIARRINRDPQVAEQLKMAFLKDYKVSLAEKIIPVTDFPEQISTVGTKTFGTSNMRFAMNGALATNTYDGVNIRIRGAMGVDGFYLFGAMTEEIKESRRLGRHHDFYHQNPAMAHVVGTLAFGLFTSDREPFAPLHHMLIEGDHYYRLLDFGSYCQA